MPAWGYYALCIIPIATVTVLLFFACARSAQISHEQGI